MPRRVDSNQAEIVNALRKMGVSVMIMSDLGKGCPDIAVGVSGRNYFFELKDGRKCPSQRKLTDYEEKFHAEWKGHVCIIESTSQAIDFVNNLRVTLKF